MMKKLLLLTAATGLFAGSAFAQTRLSLYEEFTGENCPPCAATNPTFWALCETGSNPSKMQQISYMSPIPSAGIFYYQNQTAVDARITYYGVSSAPHGYIDGLTASASSASPGHPGYFTQAELDAAQAVPSPFNITATAVWNSTYDSIKTTITIKCVTAWTASSAKLRLALVHDVIWPTPPGSNGENHFKDAVRAMFPNAAGTTINTTWNAGDSQTYVITGKVPSYVDKATGPYMVMWVQNEGTKVIAQAAKTVPLTLATDAGLNAKPITSCVSGTSGSVTPVITLRNPATNTLTSATIYYSIDGGAMMTYNWTGSLATGAQTNVNLPATTLTTGSHVIYDSVAAPNGIADVNVINNASTSIILVQSTTPSSVPMTIDFEGTTGYTLFDMNGNTRNWSIVSATGHAGSSTKMAKFDNYNFPSGETNLILLPTMNLTTQAANLTMWVAHRQYSASYLDSLAIVASTDCGATWNIIWAKGSPDLAATAVSTAAYTPAASSQWKQVGTYIPRQPAGALIGVMGISDYGNNTYVDDINISLVPISVHTVNATDAEIAIFPNPATDVANVSITLTAEAEVSVKVLAADGREVSAITRTMAAGSSTVTLNTSAFAAGIYKVLVNSGTTNKVLTLSVVK